MHTGMHRAYLMWLRDITLYKQRSMGWYLGSVSLADYVWSVCLCLRSWPYNETVCVFVFIQWLNVLIISISFSVLFFFLKWTLNYSNNNITFNNIMCSFELWKPYTSSEHQSWLNVLPMQAVKCYMELSWQLHLNFDLHVMLMLMLTLAC